MNDAWNSQIQTIHSIFETRFTDNYRNSNVRRRARLLPFIATIYRRWLYSSLLEDTLFTPSNLIEAVNLINGMPPDMSPAVSLKSNYKYNGTAFEMIDYNLASHPAVRDLKTAVEFCAPSVSLCEDDGLDDGFAAELAGELSLKDPHYAAYLVNTALWMNLLVRIPSLYSNCAQVTRDYKAKIKIPDDMLFKQIVEASIKSSSFNLNELIPLPEPVFGEALIRSLLKKPIETDEIFQNAYAMLGVSIDDIFGIEEGETLDAMDAAFISGTYMMGIAFDKYFVTPFGYYLKLIRPLYVLPFDFENEIKLFLDSAFDDDELHAAFFAPCSKYYLTNLGLEHFKVKPSRSNYVDVKATLPYEEIKNNFSPVISALEGKTSDSKANGPPLGINLGTIFVFKIKLDEASWIELEIPAEATLHRMFLEIAACFGLGRELDYSFFHGETENPFAEYAQPKRAKARKTSDIPLNALDFTHMKRMILAIYAFEILGRAQAGKVNRATMKFALELLEVKSRVPGETYPAAVRMSKKVREVY